jgi:hypothetical protein
LGGERTSNTDADDEEPFTDVADSSELNSTCKPSEKSYTHSNQSEFHEEPLRAVEPNGSLMHKTNSGSRTMIPYTDSGSRAVIPTQKEPSANSKNDSEPRATKKPSAIYRSRAMMPSTNNGPRAKNSNGNAERIDLEQDLQITNDLNGQRSTLRPKRTLKPTFKVQEN